MTDPTEPQITIAQIERRLQLARERIELEARSVRAYCDAIAAFVSDPDNDAYRLLGEAIGRRRAAALDVDALERVLTMLRIEGAR